jgi:hypothetical protein
LRQRFPDEPASAIRDRLTTHARHDAIATPDAVTTFGAGKLDLSAAIELTAPNGAPPTVVLAGPDAIALGDDAMLTPQVNATGSVDTIRARWDFDYDGRPDTDWIAVGPRAVHGAVLGPMDVRVEVRDANGYLAAATHRINVARTALMPDGGVHPIGGDGSTEGVVPGGAGCACRAATGRSGGDGAWRVLAFVAIGMGVRRRKRRVARFESVDCSAAGRAEH